MSLHLKGNSIYKKCKLSVQENRMFSQKIHASNHRSTTRFFKHKNIVQSNKENVQTARYRSTFRQTFLPSNQNNFKQSINTFKQSIKKVAQTMRSTERFSFVPNETVSTVFSPKVKDEIIKKHKNMRKTHNSNRSAMDSGAKNVFYEDKLGLQKLLQKNKLYPERCLLGMNIPKIQQVYSFSRFELFNLYTYYKTLLHSINSAHQLRKGFQSILYINKIELNSEMVDKMFQAFCTEISFNNFIKIYGNIQNLLFTQTIMEYMKSVFRQFYRQEELTSDKVLETLRDKMQEGDSIEIRTILFDHYNRNEENGVMCLNQILKACHQNLAICKRIFNAMNKLPVSGKPSKH